MTAATSEEGGSTAEAGSAPLVIAIVLNWNGSDDTVPCVESILTQSYPALQTIVLDNGSEDDSVARLRGSLPQVELVETGANLGYAGGNNVGMRLALERRAAFVFVLNNDTVLEPDCVERLVRDAQAHPEAGALAPKSVVFDSPQTIYFAGGTWDAQGNPAMIGQGALDGPAYDEPCEPDWLNGCAMLFPRAALEHVGLFDERFFLTFEDTDWSLRARKAGYTLRVVPQARLAHRVSRSFGSSRSSTYLYYYTRNNFLFVWLDFEGHERIRRMWAAAYRIYRVLRHTWRKERVAFREVSTTLAEALVDCVRGRFGMRGATRLRRP